MNPGKSLTGFSLLSLVLGVPSLLTISCSSSAPQAGNVANETAALDAPNGGLDLASKEAPAFGDPEVAALPVMSEVGVVPVTPRSRDGLAASAPSGKVAYRVALVWGHLPLSNDASGTDVAPETKQWTGSVGVDAGQVALLGTIAFGASDALAPQSTAQSLSFHSQTGAYVAGLLVRLVVPEGAARMLHVATNLGRADVDLSTLRERAGGFSHAPDGASGFGWVGFREDGCARGFVLGRWVKDAPSLGRSFAAISDADGVLQGYVRGVWGYTPARSGKVWFDKSIDLDGTSRGLVSGSYGDGFSRGLWGATDERDVSALGVGRTEGLYSDGTEAGDGRGVWLGRWSAPCMP